MAKWQLNYYLIMFFATMDFLKTSFFIVDPICIQVLEAIIQAIRCEGEVIISLPSLNRWVNGANQSNLKAISTMYD